MIFTFDRTIEIPRGGDFEFDPRGEWAALRVFDKYGRLVEFRHVQGFPVGRLDFMRGVDTSGPPDLPF